MATVSHNFRDSDLKEEEDMENLSTLNRGKLGLSSTMFHFPGQTHLTCFPQMTAMYSFRGLPRIN